LERHADRDEADGFVELLEERQLDLDAVFVAVRPDVFFKGRLRETMVEFPVRGDEAERRLPFVVRDGERGARAVMVRPEDYEGRRPPVCREGRIAMSRDGTGIHIPGMRHNEAEDPPLAALHVRDTAGTQRMGIAFPDLAEKGIL